MNDEASELRELLSEERDKYQHVPFIRCRFLDRVPPTRPLPAVSRDTPGEYRK